MRRFIPIAVVLGLAANAAPAAGAPTPKSLTLGVKPNPVVFGRTLTLGGVFKADKPAGKDVGLQADAFPYDGKFANVLSVKTASNGVWSAIVKPAVNTRYRAHQGGTRSPVVTVAVRIRVSLKISDRTPAAGHRVRFSGRACPEHDGALVGIQRRTRTKKWKTVRRTRLRDVAGSTCSRFSKRLRVRHDGTYRAKVISPHGDHANGVSRRRRVDVH